MENTDKGDEEPNPVLASFGQGTAAWALATAMLAHLAERKIISRDEGVTIIDRALSGLEWIAEAPAGPGLHEGRLLLERLLVGWRGTPKA
jgi:hypothetical protein